MGQIQLTFKKRACWEPVLLRDGLPNSSGSGGAAGTDEMLGSSTLEWEELRLTSLAESALVGVFGPCRSDDRRGIVMDLGDSTGGGLGRGFAELTESASCMGEAVRETAELGPIMGSDTALTSTVRNGGVGLRDEMDLERGLVPVSRALGVTGGTAVMS